MKRFWVEGCEVATGKPLDAVVEGRNADEVRDRAQRLGARLNVIREVDSGIPTGPRKNASFQLSYAAPSLSQPPMSVTTLAQNPGNKLEDWDGWQLYEHFVVSNNGVAIPLDEISEFSLHYENLASPDTVTLIIEAIGFGILMAALRILGPILALLVVLWLLATAYDLGGGGLLIIVCLMMIVGGAILSGDLKGRSRRKQCEQKVKLVHRQSEYFLTFGSSFLAELAIKRFQEAQRSSSLWSTDRLCRRFQRT